MASTAEIDALYESTLKPRLQALEGLRQELKAYLTKAGILIGVPAVLLWANDIFALALPDGLSWLPMVVGIVALVAGLLVAGFKYALPGFAAFSNYRVRFKHEVAAEVFKIVCPTAAYSPLDGIAESVFDEPGLFNARGSFTADDRVRGIIGQTPFEAADVRRSYSTGGKNSRTVVVFSGLFFHIDFNKRLNGTTVVDPAGAASSSIGERSGLKEVALENPAFSERFTVYSSDEVEARYILTPAMMERILALQARTEHHVHLAFRHNRAYLGVNYGRALFEPGIRESTSVEAIHEMAAHFGLAEGIVEELDLNTRIWTKGVDTSLLTAPGDDAPEDVFKLAAKQGTLTPERLWQVALETSATTDTSDEAADAAVAAPSGTGIAIDRTAGVTTVNYGFGLGFVIGFAIWALATAVWLDAVRLLPVALDLPQLEPLVASVPQVAALVPFVSHVPLAWLIGSTVIGGVAFLTWGVRVRKVEIAADAVRIWRGLRPVPRTYVRPAYGKIVRVDGAVYVGRTSGFSLLNASASPMLDVDEARWVATEMRRAVRESAR